MMMPVDVGWKEEWVAQQEQVQCWRAVLEEEKEVLLAFEDCVTQIKKLHNVLAIFHGTDKYKLFVSRETRARMV